MSAMSTIVGYDTDKREEHIMHVLYSTIHFLDGTVDKPMARRALFIFAIGASYNEPKVTPAKCREWMAMENNAEFFLDMEKVMGFVPHIELVAIFDENVRNRMT